VEVEPMTGIRNRIEVLLVACLLAAYYLTGLSAVEFHLDESHWIATSNALENYARVHSKAPLWEESYWTLTQPPVVRYVIGLGRSLGGYDVRSLNPPWDFDRDRDFNMRIGAMPSSGLLWWSRLPMATFAVLSLLLLFVLLRRSAGRLAAYTWTILVLLNFFLRLNLRRAMGESCILLFTVLAMAIVCRALDSTGWRGKWWGAAGMLCGLAWASKLNGLVISAACMLLVCLGSSKDVSPWKGRLWSAVRACLLVSGLSIVVFVGLNPFLWPDPVGRTMGMFANRTTEMAEQAATYPAEFMGPLPQRLPVMIVRVLRDYASLPLPPVVNLIPCLLGFGLMVGRSWRWWRGKEGNPAPVVLLVISLFASVPTLFACMDWERYYLFPVFFSTAFSAVGLGWILQRELERWAPLTGRVICGAE
jgi:4-amino-4-deoxy-L-arabinose transferase-like glycosyltransferase